MRARSHEILCSAFIVVALLAFTGSQASAAIVKAQCDKGESLQERLDNKAKQGDTVEVTGSCDEAVTIAKDGVSLVCLDGASITAPADPAAVRVTTVTVLASNVVIQDCSISGPEANGGGISILRSGSAVLTGNTVSGLSSGVGVTQSSYLRLFDGNTLTDNRTGLVIAGASNADVAFNSISGNKGNGVVVTRGGSAEFVGNQVNDNGTSGFGNGFVVTQGGTADFSGDLIFGDEANQIQGNDRGIFCSTNATLNFDNHQDFGAGNPSGNFLFLTASPNFCVVSGEPSETP